MKPGFGGTLFPDTDRAECCGGLSRLLTKDPDKPEKTQRIGQIYQKVLQYR